MSQHFHNNSFNSNCNISSLRNVGAMTFDDVDSIFSHKILIFSSSFTRQFVSIAQYSVTFLSSHSRVSVIVFRFQDETLYQIIN